MPLKRVLTLRTVVATSAGITLATSSFVAAAQVAGFLAGNSAWLSILVSGFLCILVGACYSELNGILPSAAGIRLYLGKAFGEKTALIFSLLYMLVMMVAAVGVESFVLSKTLNYSVPQVAPVIWITVMLAIVTLMNIRGIKVAGTFQEIVTYGVIVSTLLISLWGLKLVHFHLTAPLATGGVSDFIQAVAVGIFLFVGFEWVTPLAEEVTESRIIAHGMFIAVGITCIVYALFTVAMMANVSRGVLVNSPIPQVLLAKKVLGGAGLVWILFVCLACSFGTFNAGLLSISRFFYATAREHALPPVFSRISMRFMTPWVAVIAVFVVGYASSLVVLFTGRYLALVDMAAAIQCIIYALSAAAVIVLRKKMADAPRAFKVPFGPLIPVFTILIFTLLAVMTIVTDPAIGYWMVAGLVVIGIYVLMVVPRIKEKYKVKRPPRMRKTSATEARVGPVPGSIPAVEKGGDKV